MDAQRRPDLRAGDAEREVTLERLRAAHTEGRLDVDEFYTRVDSAYTARTFGELDALVVDLPATGLERFPTQPSVAYRPPRSYPAPASDQTGIGGLLAAMPAALRGMWLTWATVVSINIVVWTLVSALGGLTYFWPAWVAGPWGIVNLGITASWWFNRDNDGGRPEIGPG